MSPRRVALAVAGVVSALAVASTPLAASADTGFLVPVRYKPAAGSSDPTYLNKVAGAHALVYRGSNQVSFYVHDTSLAAGTPIFFIVFNAPQNCSPAITAGKVDQKTGQVVSLCDPGVDHSYSVVLGPKWAPDAHGNQLLTLKVGQQPVIFPPKAPSLTNPRGAEIAVQFGPPGPHNDQILIASPYRPDGDE